MTNPSKPHVVIVGSSNTDLVLVCERLPKPGETLLGGHFERFAGGKGANQSVAAVRAGARVTFVGAHGPDDFGERAKAGLAKEGIDTRYFKAKTGSPSGIALILVGGQTRQNMIAVAKSANEKLAPADVARARATIGRSAAVVAQLEITPATVQAVATEAAKAGVPFILNPAPARKLPRSLLKIVHALTPNEHEAALLTGLHDPVKAAKKLRQMGCGHVVVTLGAKGALLVTADGVTRVKAPKVKPVDTVGAGDCFTAWLAVGIASGLTLPDAAKRAVRAASISVTRPGAQSGMPYLREVVRL